MGVIALSSPPSTKHPTVGIEGLQKVVGPWPAACSVTQTFCIFPGESEQQGSCMFCESHTKPKLLPFWSLLNFNKCYAPLIHFSFSKVAEPSCWTNSLRILKRCGFSLQSHLLPILSQSQFSSQWFSCLPGLQDKPNQERVVATSPHLFCWNFTQAQTKWKQNLVPQFQILAKIS